MRRLLAAWVLVSLVTILQFPRPGALAAPPAAGTEPAYDLPLIDAHEHFQGQVRAEDLVHLMDLSGVSRMVLSAELQQGASDGQAVDFAQQFPNRFVPFVTLQEVRLATRQFLNPDGAALELLRQAEDKFKSRKFFGLGELGVRVYAFGPYAETDHPADAPLMHRFADLAARYQVPFLIHLEGVPSAVAAVERLLDAHKDTRIVMAHSCGRLPADRIKLLLAHHANLFCDLSHMVNFPNMMGSGFPRMEPWTALIEDGHGHLYAEMKELYEAFPDRFMVGIDCTSYPAWGRYQRDAVRYRQLISELSPATARKLAHENAERIFGLAPARP